MKHRRKKNYYNNLHLKNTLNNYYTNLNLQLFKWDVKFDFFNEFYFEKALITQGVACLIKRNNDYFSLKYANAGMFDIYAQPLLGRGIGFGKSIEFKVYQKSNKEEANGVICYDTLNHTNNYDYVSYLLDNMVDLIRLYNTLIIQSKRPYILLCEEKEVINIENMFNDINSNLPAIFGYKNIDMDNFKTLDVPNKIPDLKLVSEQILFTDSLIKKHLGINTSDNTDKKERLIVDEINANNQAIDIILQNRLRSRLNFCESVKELFNIDINVELTINNELKGGDNDKLQSYPQNNKIQ